MTDRFRVPSALVRQLEELGVPPAAVLRRAGLPEGLLDQSRILVTTDELFRLHAPIPEVGADPAIGLKLGSEQRIERYSPTAIAALYSRTFRDALETDSAVQAPDMSGRDSHQRAREGVHGGVRVAACRAGGAAEPH